MEEGDYDVFILWIEGVSLSVVYKRWLWSSHESLVRSVFILGGWWIFPPNHQVMQILYVGREHDPISDTCKGVTKETLYNINFCICFCRIDYNMKRQWEKRILLIIIDPYMKPFVTRHDKDLKWFIY